MIVLRTEPPAPIRWQCSVCADEGIISDWADSPFDLRPRRLTLARPVNEIVISEEEAAALRELRPPPAHLSLATNILPALLLTVFPWQIDKCKQLLKVHDHRLRQ